METINYKKHIWQSLISLLLLAIVLVFTGCDNKSRNRNTNGLNSAYKQCETCPLQTDVLARAWGMADDQYRKLEMGLHFYIDIEEYDDAGYNNNYNGQYLGQFQGEAVWAEGYMYVDRDNAPSCAMAPGFYEVRTISPAQLNYNSFYTVYGSGVNVTGLRLEAIHEDTDEIVEMNWDNAEFSTLNPYVISEIDGVEYPNGIEAPFVRIEAIYGSGFSCTPSF